MTTDIVEPGLRERKRRATLHAIESAAIDLATERGHDRVTVDEISYVAGISPRTFFNYFPSKDAALIGEHPELPARDQVIEFVRAGAESVLLDDLGELISRSVETSGADAQLNEKRRTLLKREPKLFAIRMAAMREFEEGLRTIVAERLEHDDPASALDPAWLLRRSRLITLMAFAAVRQGWATWADAGGSIALGDAMRQSFTELHEVLGAARVR